MSSLTNCLRKSGKNISPADREDLMELRQQIMSEGIEGDRANEQAVSEHVEALQIERLTLLDNIDQAGGDTTAERPLYSRPAAKIAPATNPEGRPAAPADELDQGIPTDLTQDQKYDVARQMAEENQAIVDPILERIGNRLGIALESDIKSRASSIGKANRPNIIRDKGRPWWNMEHLKDVFRFKATLDTYDQAATVLLMLNQELQASGGIAIIKTDTDKVLSPLQFGWRPIAVDIQFANGQIGEFYMAPTELMEANSGEGHNLFERWRFRDLESLTRRERVRAERDITASETLYADALDEYLVRTDQDESAVEASLLSLLAASESVTRRNSLAKSSKVRPSEDLDQTPAESRNATNLGSRITTRESDTDSEIMAGSVPVYSVGVEPKPSLFTDRGMNQPATGEAIKAAQLRVALAPAIRSLVGKVQVHVAETTAELPGAAVPGDVEGVWYTGTDQVWLVAENLHDIIRAKKVMAHETLGHLAMEEQPEFDDILKAIRNLKNMGNVAINKAAEQVAATQGQLDSRTETKEILAVMVENGIQSGTVNRALAALRQMLRRIGLNLDYTEGEIRELAVRAATGLHRDAAAKRAAIANMPLQAQLLADPRTVDQAIHAAINDIHANATLMDMGLMLHQELENISGSDDPVQQERATELRRALYRAQIAPAGSPDMIDPDALYSVAYHGTAATFASFSTKYIGSGEGFQAYGWGLYFSSAKEIAEWYRGKLSEQSWSYDGKTSLRRMVESKIAKRIEKKAPKNIYKTNRRVHASAIARSVTSLVMRHRGDLKLIQAEIDQAVHNLGLVAADWRGVGGENDVVAGKEKADKYTLDAELWKAAKAIVGEVKYIGKSGVLYTVEIPDEQHMIRYHHPLTEQSDEVTAILQENFPELWEQDALVTIRVLPAGYDVIVTSGPNDSTKSYGIVPPGQTHARPMAGSHPSIEMAKGAAVGQINSEAEYKRKKPRADTMAGYSLIEWLGREIVDPPSNILQKMLPGFVGAIQKMSADQKASIALDAMGIPGHLFAGASSGERNYVVYDGTNVEIKETQSKDSQALFSRAGKEKLEPRYEPGTQTEWRGVGSVGQWHIWHKGHNDYRVSEGRHGPLTRTQHRQQSQAWNEARQLHNDRDQADAFATPEEQAGLRGKQAMQNEIDRRDAKRNTGQDNIETGDGGDLFSEARNQGELFSRAISADEEIEAMIAAKMATPLEDIRVKDRVRTVVQKIKAMDWLSIKQGMLDSTASIEALEKGLFGEVLDASESAHKAVLATKNLGSVMAAVMHSGIPIMRNGVFMPRADRKGFIEIFEKITHHEDGNLLAQWELYAAAYRSQRLIRERNADGSSKEKNFTQAEINKALTLATQYPEFEVARKEWQVFNGQMLDLAIKQGVINGEEAKLWRQNDYVPFYRAMEEIEYEGGQGPKAGRGIANVRPGIKRLTGSDKPLGNVFENMVMNTSYLIDAVYRNNAMQRIVSMADGIAMEKIPMAWEAIKIQDGDMARALMKAGLIVGQGTTEADMFNDGIRQVKAMSSAQKEHWSKIFRKVAPKGDNIVSVLQEGKPVYYRVDDPLLLRSIGAMGAQSFGGVMNTFRLAKRTLTGAITIDPAFMMANFIRDTLSTWVVADHGAAPPFLKALKGAKSAWTQDEDSLQLMMAGAGGGGFYDHNPTEVRKMLAKKMPKGQIGAFTNSVLTPRGMWRFWQKVGNASEQANRVAKYRQVIADGGTIAEAAYQARDVLNFTMSGDYEAMKFIVQTVPFINARMQGLYRLARGAKENPINFAMKGTAIMVATLALLAKNRDNDDYEELPEWDKDTYWHFFVGDEHFRLPKPFEVGALFATIPERAVRLGSGDENLDLFGERMWRMAADTFAFNPIPQLVKPLVEQYANRNMFTGNPIIGMAHEGMQPEAQYDPWTSETMRAMANGMPDFAPEWMRSPKRLQAAARGYFGAVGMYALGASDSVTRRAMGHPDRPAKAIQDYPVITRFWRNPEPRTSKFSSELYDMMHEADAIYRTMNAYRDQGRIEEYQEIRGNNIGKLQARKHLNNVAGQVRKINKQMRNIQYSLMSPEDKRTALDQLNQQKIHVLSQVAAVSDLY